jgi:hypothetical protein
MIYLKKLYYRRQTFFRFFFENPLILFLKAGERFVFLNLKLNPTGNYFLIT